MRKIKKSKLNLKILKQRRFNKRETSTDDILVGGKINKEKPKTGEDVDHLNAER